MYCYVSGTPHKHIKVLFCIIITYELKVQTIYHDLVTVFIYHETCIRSEISIPQPCTDTHVPENRIYDQKGCISHNLVQIRTYQKSYILSKNNIHIPRLIRTPQLCTDMRVPENCIYDQKLSISHNLVQIQIYHKSYIWSK